MRELTLNNDTIAFEGADSFEQVNGGIAPCRLPIEQEALIHPELMIRARCASGVRLTTISNTTSIAITLNCVLDTQERMCVDLVIDNELVATEATKLNETHTITFTGLSAETKRIELWLPQFGRVTVLKVEVDNGANTTRFEDPRPKWITYGSTITHCRQAHSPAMIWPAIVARKANVNLRSFGFGGNCHFEQIVARHIANCPADRISLKLGINTYGGGTYNARTWAAAVIGFILTVRDAHPDTPLLLISPIASPERETTPNDVGLTLEWMRDQLENIVGTFRGRGDTNIHYLHGHEMFNLEDVAEGLLPDGLHPNGDGYARMGDRLAELAFGAGKPLAI